MKKNASPPLDPTARRVISIVFVTMFIDLVGFSIIFPLFPSMLEYYRATEGSSGLFGAVYSALEWLSQTAGAQDSEWGIIVLFGGMLGSLFSLLQFFFAPLWGRWSDRYGRRPILIVTMCGIWLSYLLWAFAGSFALLVLARLLGGIASGNISTATAVVADVTTPQTRSKGMAFIGIAFGLGFILGPAIGGLSAHLDLTQQFPGLAAYGINPYSVPALLALALTTVNLVSVYLRLPETRPEAAAPASERTVNPLRMLLVPEYPGVSRVNLIYFIYLLAFSGIEFSLTFLAAERFGFGPRQNAYIFLYVGILLALVQGSYVQAYSARVGVRRMALHGLLMNVPGLALIGVAGQVQSLPLLFLGLTFTAAGGAQTIPCLTSLSSLYTPPEAQGRVMGLFRSLGSLGRGVGPLIACVLYWRAGATATYIAAAISILVPAALILRLPREE